MLRRKKRAGNVVFEDADGKRLQPWAVRAGMLITATDYSHGSHTVVCRVEMAPVDAAAYHIDHARFGTIDAAMEHIEHEHTQRMAR